MMVESPHEEAINTKFIAMISPVTEHDDESKFYSFYVVLATAREEVISFVFDTQVEAIAVRVRIINLIDDGK